MTVLSNAPPLDLEELEDQRDAVSAMLARMESANEERIPFDVIKRLSACEDPITVWREHRDLSEAALRERVDRLVRPDSDHPELRRLAATARVLNVDVEDLIPWTREGDPLP